MSTALRRRAGGGTERMEERRNGEGMGGRKERKEGTFGEKYRYENLAN